MDGERKADEVKGEGERRNGRGGNEGKKRWREVETKISMKGNSEIIFFGNSAAQSKFF